MLKVNSGIDNGNNNRSGFTFFEDLFVGQFCGHSRSRSVIPIEGSRDRLCEEGKRKNRKKSGCESLLKFHALKV